jgi:cyanophycinase
MKNKMEILKLALISLGKDSDVKRIEAIEDKVHPAPVIAIGGAEDKTFHAKILRKVFEIAGGEGIDITIIPWASEKKEAGEIYKKIFSHFGAKDIFLLKKKSEKEAKEAFEKSALIFLVGGDQKRLMHCFEELNLIDEIKKANKRGVVVAGTSAGASILGQHMPYYSDEEEKVIYLKGFSLIDGTIIDQHFSQRHRIQRLKDAVDRFKPIVGIGLDEDTAIGFKDNKEIFRIGDGNITILR